MPAWSAVHLTFALTAASSAAPQNLLRWLYRLGGPGLILLGLVDNSVVPVTGSMDVFTILLCAQGREWWPYYAFMATAGAVLGGYTTYRLAHAQGNRREVRRQSWMQRVKKMFERWGAWSIVLPALLPPPFPMVPFLTVAGVAQYPRKKFLFALATGRAVRYAILGYLGYHYGRWILTLIRTHVTTIIVVGCVLVAGSVALAFFRFKSRSAYAS